MADSIPSAAFGALANLFLSAELGRWRRAGVRPRLWWRDDDARAPSAALDRLLEIASERPLALAVIPNGGADSDLSGLAHRLRGERRVTIGQHGVDHQNRRHAGPRSEYPAPPTIEAMRARISGGQVRLLEAGLTPRFYTPPWNAIDPGLPVALAQLGVPVLSAGATWIGQPGVHYLSAEIDLLSWKRGQRFKGTLRVLPALRRALAVRRVTGAYGRPIGLLTHHLVHDAATWRFLDLALPWLDRRFEWVGVDVSDAATSRQVIRAEGPVSAGMAKPLAV